jgi:MYXO-CTERM domain-containing protein
MLKQFAGAAMAMMMALVLGAGTAGADVVYSYTFDGLDGTGTGPQLDGQDNWQSWVDLKNDTPGNDTVHNIVTDEQGIYKSGTRTIAALNRSDRDLSARPNDGNWDFSIPNGGQFSIEYYTRIGNPLKEGQEDYYSVKLEIYDTTDMNTMPVGFGYDGTSNKWRVVGSGDSILSTNEANDGSFQYFFIKLDVDLSANGGEGAATFYAEQVDNISPDPVRSGYGSPVTGLEDVNLGLATAKLNDTSNWGGIRLDLLQNALVDEIQITVETTSTDAPVAEPAGLGLLGLALLGLKRRRK